MATKKNKSLLPLLAITTLLLSIGIVRYKQPLLLGNKSSQSVLSDTDEIKSEERDNSGKGEDKVETENKTEKKEEVRKTEERKTIEVKKVESRETPKSTEKPKSKIEIVEDKSDSDNDEDVKNDEIETESETEVEVEQKNDQTANDDTLSKFKLKIKTRTVAGKTVVETESGEVEVENNPEDSINNLVDGEVLDIPLSFEAKTNDKNEVEFEIQGVEDKKLFGLFDLKLMKTVTVNSTTGEVVSTKQDLWNQVLNLLSI